VGLLLGHCFSLGGAPRTRNAWFLVV
jgi:hypothetical protein